MKLTDNIPNRYTIGAKKDIHNSEAWKSMAPTNLGKEMQPVTATKKSN